MHILDDPRPRPQDWKRHMARLDSAYQSGGHAALEAMEAMEPLALRNEKVRDYKMMSNWVEVHPDDTVARRDQQELVAEINDLTGWINAKLREQDRAMKQEKPRNRDFDMER